MEGNAAPRMIRWHITEAQYAELAGNGLVGWNILDPDGNVIEAGPVIEMQAVADMTQPIPYGQQWATTSFEPVRDEPMPCEHPESI